MSHQDLVREQLGTIQVQEALKLLEDVREETEHSNYIAAISAIFPELERDIKVLTVKQAQKTTEAENWEQVIYSRGTINGFSTLLEIWRQADAEHKGKIPKPKFDEHNPLPEL